MNLTFNDTLTLFFSTLCKPLLCNYYETRNTATFSLIFTRVSSLRGEKNFFFEGEGFSTELEPVMTVITRWILMHFSIPDISYGSLKVPRTAPNWWTYVLFLFFSLPFSLFLFTFSLLSLYFPLPAFYSTFSLCFSLNFYLHETCGQVFRVSPLSSISLTFHSYALVALFSRKSSGWCIIRSTSACEKKSEGVFSLGESVVWINLPCSVEAF